MKYRYAKQNLENKTGKLGRSKLSTVVTEKKMSQSPAIKC